MASEAKEFNEIPQHDIPEWINDELFRDALKIEYPSPELQVKIISVKPAVASGENYFSKIYRIEIETSDGVKTENKRFIIKHILEYSEIELNENMKEFVVLAKEHEIYYKILPNFENEFKKIGEDIQFGPKLYKVLTTEAEALVFEDLNMRNYYVADRIKGLDLDHCEVFYKKLAKFHAVSAVYHEKNESFDIKLFSSPFTESLEKFNEDFVKGLYPHFIDMIRKNDVLKHLADRIEMWYPVHHREMCRLTAPSSDPDTFQVLCHGDTWVNNFLFTYDADKKPTDMLFIDYQLCFWSSPVYDLIYFFASSTEFKLKESSLDYLIHCYHGELIKNLKKLKYSRKIPSLRDLHIDILQRGFLGAMLSFGLMPIILLESRDDANLNNLLNAESDDLRKAMFSSMSYLKNVEAWCLLLEKKGLLDIL